MLSRRTILASGASAVAMTVAGCVPGQGPAPDINSAFTDITVIITRAQQIVSGICTYVPTFSTLAGIVIAIVGTFAGIPSGAAAIEQLAQKAAQDFCDAVGKQVRKGVRLRLLNKRGGLRDAVPGAPIISYGPVVINGHPVDIEVLQPV